MSNVALFSASNVPAFAKKAELSAVAKALAGGSGASGKRISIKGGVFRLLVDGKEVAAIDERFLDVVIVNAASKVGRTFYMKAYDGETPSGPDCWSPDGEKPDATAANPQSERCATCPQNIQGSGQGTSRACRYSQRLAVVLANDIEGDVHQLQLPATSIWDKDAKGEDLPLQAYARRLAAQGVSPETLVTRMKFDTKSEAPKLFFRPTRWLTEDEYATAVEKGQSEEAKRAVTMTVAQVDKVEAPAPLALEGAPPSPIKAQEASSTPKRGRPPKAKVEEPAAEEDDVEPTIKKDEKPAPAAKPSLASLADQWDDE